jgi:hypothetical protein
MAAHFRVREFAWFQYQDGILDQAAWESYLYSTRSMLNSSPTAVQIWEQTDGGFAPGFVAAVNNAAGIQ